MDATVKSVAAMILAPAWAVSHSAFSVASVTALQSYEAHLVFKAAAFAASCSAPVNFFHGLTVSLAPHAYVIT